MQEGEKKKLQGWQIASIVLALVFLLALPAIKQSAFTIGAAFERQQGLAQQAALVTRTETVDGKAAPQDGGYTYTARCILHVNTSKEVDKTFDMPCSTFTRFDVGDQVRLGMYDGVVVEVTNEGDPIEAVWGWNGGWMVLAALLYAPFNAVAFYCIAWLIRFAVKRPKMRIGFAVTVATLVGWTVCIAQCVVPQFTHDPANPLWPLLAAVCSYGFFALLMAYSYWQARPFRKSLKKRGKQAA